MNINFERLDELDLEIIEHLQEDGRKPYREIAEATGFTERTIRLRVSQLRESGILQIVGVVNPIEVGLQAVAIIQIEVDEPSMEECIRQLNDMEEVRFITRITGEYPLLIQVVTRSYDMLLQFLQKSMKQLPYIRRTNVMIELEVYKNEFRLSRNTSRPFITESGRL